MKIDELRRLNTGKLLKLAHKRAELDYAGDPEPIVREALIAYIVSSGGCSGGCGASCPETCDNRRKRHHD